MASCPQGSICRCLESQEARDISSQGKAHVHCSCILCAGRAVYPMTAWRHAQKTKRTKLEITEDDEAVNLSSGSASEEQSVSLLSAQVSDSYVEFGRSRSSSDFSLSQSDLLLYHIIQSLMTWFQ